jgi:hypothetical protein
VVVNNPTAFAERYGDKIEVAGTYSGNLSNGGEQLILLDSAGGIILSFAYDDAWYPVTDGDGPSLVSIDPTDLSADWSAAPAWRASLAVDGSPGSSDRVAGDINGDAKVDLLDLAILQSHLGTTTGAAWTDGDLTGDGAVNRADAALLASLFGTSTGGIASPAASSAVVVTAEARREPARAAVARRRAIVDLGLATRGIDLSAPNGDQVSKLSARPSRSRTIVPAADVVDSAIVAFTRTRR